MDVHRVLLAAVVCLGFAGAALAQETGPTKPWKQVRGFGRVLDLRNPPVVIDEPGLYAIDRDWRIPGTTTAVVPELIQITANDVTLDLHGFEISADITPPPSATLFVITGQGTEIRNGGFGVCCEGATAVRSTTFPRFHHVSFFSDEPMTFEGGASITDSDIGVRTEMRFAGGATLERNTVSCNRGIRCIRLLGNGNQIANNTLSTTQGGGIEVAGNGSLLENNVVDRSDDVDGFTAFDVKGNHNVVRGNTVLLGPDGGGQPIWAISGTANTLDGNIAASPGPGVRALTGIQFTADGNFYGNNRMAAEVPFALGGTVQTDWGGNVGY